MPFFTKVLLLFISCILFSTFTFGQPKATLKQQIKTLESEVLKQGTTLNIPLATKLISKYKAYANQFKPDTLCANYLMKAADISRGIGKCSQSIVLLEKAKMTYPKVKQVEDVLFLQGYIFENCLNDAPKAKQKYENFIRIYPNHRLVPVAKTSLQFLGKGPEELLKMIKGN